MFPKLLDFGIAKLLAPEDAAQAQDAHRRADRHAVLHVARAVPRPRRRSPHRHLLVRRARVPDADRRVSVRRRRLHVDPDAADQRAAGAAVVASCRAARRTIDDVVRGCSRRIRRERPPDLRTAVRALEQAAATPASHGSRRPAGTCRPACRASRRDAGRRTIARRPRRRPSAAGARRRRSSPWRDRSRARATRDRRARSSRSRGVGAS